MLCADFTAIAYALDDIGPVNRDFMIASNPALQVTYIRIEVMVYLDF